MTTRRIEDGGRGTVEGTPRPWRTAVRASGRERIPHDAVNYMSSVEAAGRTIASMVGYPAGCNHKNEVAPNAALIVAAVNAYDRLLDIEAAARALQPSAEAWINAVAARDNKAAWQAANAMYLAIVKAAPTPPEKPEEAK